MKARDVLKVLQISRRTLTRYVKSGLVKIDAEINGQYRYNAESVFSLIGKPVPDEYK
jgi:predicted site-specific integrase-resolvase